MRIKTENGIIDVPAVWIETEDPNDPETWSLKGIDQTKIPYQLEFFILHQWKDIPLAIKEMIVRGAPTIGATAALGMVLTVRDVLRSKEIIEKPLKILNAAAGQFLNSRPTAVDLRNGVLAVLDAVNTENDVKRWPFFALEAARKFVDKIVQDGKLIGIHGKKLIKNGHKILTHCNAGPLAHVDYGSALSPILQAHQKGKKIFTWIDETRPRLQGAKLTSWELQQNDIPHCVIADNTAGFLMQKGEIDMVIVGADRVVRNGDIANKIGTYSLSVLAKEHDIPFYVAFPTSTIDLTIKNGKDIPIEMRDPKEVTHVLGWRHGKWMQVAITPEGTNALNYAFDITPARYISGYITPVGVFSDFKELLTKLKDPINS